MAKPKLTAKEELFSQAFIARTGDKVQAYKDAGYSVNMSNASMAVQADKLYNKPKINLRIKELQKTASAIANERFTVSIEQRVKWLNEVAIAGLELLEDATGASKRQNLASTCKAIEVLNSMLGIDEVSDKVKPVKVFVGVVDAS